MAGVAPTVTLNNGRQMPVVGLGTWMLDRANGKNLIKAAIDAGYRHFDTALLYHSEAVIGEAIREKIAEGTVKREDIFVTSKLWCSYAHPGMVVKACQLTLRNLGLDYVDLYLIHWPFSFKAVENPEEMAKIDFKDAMTLMGVKEYFPRDESGNLLMSDQDYVDTWKEMEQCVQRGLAKSIGISNFDSHQIERVLQQATIKPVTNQVEVHPYLNQKKLNEFCKSKGIVLTAYGPLGAAVPPRSQNLPRLIDHPEIVKLAQKKNKTTAQIILRYLVQLGTIVIPKTDNPKRLVENISIFDFSLSPDEMTQMDSLNHNHRIYIVPGTEKHKHYPFNREY